MQEQWRGKHIFNMKIVWEDLEGLISVYENDEPSILSQEFIKANNLPEAYSELIEQEIEHKIVEVLKTESQDSEFCSTDLFSKPSVFKNTGQSSKCENKIGLKADKRISQYVKIFKFLADGDFITPQSLSCLDLKHKLCKILMPLLIDLNGIDEFVDFDQFFVKITALETLLGKEDLNYLKNFQLDLRSVSPKERKLKFERALLNETISKRFYN